MSKAITISKYIDKQVNWLHKEGHSVENICKAFSNVIAYNDFGKNKPKIHHFIECDKEGNVLEEPKRYDANFDWSKNISNETPQWYLQNKAYQEAKERKWFKGCEYKEGCIYLPKDREWIDLTVIKTYEDLIPYGLELTEHKAKELGL